MPGPRKRPKMSLSIITMPILAKPIRTQPHPANPQHVCAFRILLLLEEKKPDHAGPVPCVPYHRLDRALPFLAGAELDFPLTEGAVGAAHLLPFFFASPGRACGHSAAHKVWLVMLWSPMVAKTVLPFGPLEMSSAQVCPALRM